MTSVSSPAWNKSALVRMIPLITWGLMACAPKETQIDWRPVEGPIMTRPTNPTAPRSWANSGAWDSR